MLLPSLQTKPSEHTLPQPAAFCRLRIKEDVSGRMYARSSSPNRALSQDSDGPYESENMKAAPASEAAIPELMCGKLRCRITGTSTMLDKPTTHEQTEMKKDFIDAVFQMSPIASPALLSWSRHGQGNHARSPRSFSCPLLHCLLPSDFIPSPRMCSSSKALGIPNSIAGLNPNGPPSVFEANSIRSPYAYA